MIGIPRSNSSNRSHFDEQLRLLQDDLLVLASMVEKAIDRSIQALVRRDLVEARRIIAEDFQINRKRFDIEDRCIQLIATQQPMATDLRVLASILYIIADLERMADHAEGIAKINVLMGDEPLLKPLIDIPRMADKGRSMLRRAMDAFVARDTVAANAIANEDDEVDALYNQVDRELLTFMLNDPRTISRATYLMWAAHNLERFADRVTNICERVVYMVTGRMEEVNVSKY